MEKAIHNGSVGIFGFFVADLWSFQEPKPDACPRNKLMNKRD